MCVSLMVYHVISFYLSIFSIKIIRYNLYVVVKVIHINNACFMSFESPSVIPIVNLMVITVIAPVRPPHQCTSKSSG